MVARIGRWSLIHRDVEAVAANLVRHLHLNPAHHYPQIFIDAASRTSDTRLMLIALGAAAYSAVRLVEAYGLWFARRWAEWFAAAAGGIYMPFEIYELVHRGGWRPAVALLVNILIVGVMLYALFKKRSGVR